MAVSARFLAMEILREWEGSGLRLDQVMAGRLAGVALPDPRDRQLAVALVQETVRRLGYIDWLLGRFSKHPLPGMKPRTRQALRIGAVQLLFFDRIPAAAAVDETVKALKGKGQPAWLTGFVNGVLRSLVRARGQLPEPEQEEKDPARALAIRTSHPLWLVERWLKRVGLETARRRGEAGNLLPPLTLRVSAGRGSREELQELLARAGLEAVPGLFGPQALMVREHRGDIAALPGYAEGLFQVQDEAAQLVCLLFEPRAGGRYLDACAGLGGKTGQLAELAGPEGRVTAVEPSERRLALLRENLDRLGLADRVAVLAGELSEVAGSLQARPFTGVLMDAPCSGLGVIRRHPDIRWLRTPEDFPRLRARQEALLAAAAPLVEAGGTLVYATCSTEPEENEEVVAAFLRAQPGFRVVDARTRLPAGCAELVDRHGFLRTVPELRSLDGFFAAALERARA